MFNTTKPDIFFDVVGPLHDNMDILMPRMTARMMKRNERLFRHEKVLSGMLRNAIWAICEEDCVGYTDSVLIGLHNADV